MLQSLALTYNYNNYTLPSNSSSATTAGANIALFICGVVFVVFCIIFGLTVMWRLFAKAGRPGWAALIPFYNSWVMAEIAGKPGWWILLSFIPLVGWFIFIVLYIIICIELVKRFGKNPWFALMLIIPPLPLIGFTMLAYGKSQYQGNDPGTSPGQTPVTPMQFTDADSGVQVTISTPPTPDTTRPKPPRPPRGLIQ